MDYFEKANHFRRNYGSVGAQTIRRNALFLLIYSKKFHISLKKIATIQILINIGRLNICVQLYIGANGRPAWPGQIFGNNIDQCE